MTTAITRRVPVNELLRKSEADGGMFCTDLPDNAVVLFANNNKQVETPDGPMPEHVLDSVCDAIAKVLVHGETENMRWLRSPSVTAKIRAWPRGCNDRTCGALDCECCYPLRGPEIDEDGNEIPDFDSIDGCTPADLQSDEVR